MTFQSDVEISEWRDTSGRSSVPLTPRAVIGHALSKSGRQVPVASVIAFVLIGICLLFAWQRFVMFGHPESISGRAYNDLNVFVLVGRLALAGHLQDAYSSSALHLAQVADGSMGNFMPWGYPPLFDLVVTGLAMMSLTAAFVALILVPFLATLWLIRRLAGPQFSYVVICVFPGFMDTLLCCQNGFLTATLFGCFALASLAGRAVAGVPLGLMIIKPHLGVLIAVQTLVTGRGRALAVATGVVVATSALATLAFGPQVWGWFLHAAHEVSGALADARFTLFFMISPYSTVRAMGLSAPAAFAIQTVLAVGCVAATVMMARRRIDPRILQGMVILMSLAVSPYAFEYDTPILGIAAALLAGPVMERAQKWQLAAILALFWVVSGSEIFGWIYVPANAGSLATGWRHQPISFAGPAYVAIIALVMWVLRGHFVKADARGVAQTAQA